MTTKKKTAEPQADTPTQLLDAHGNPGMVTAGQIIESAWGNAVVARTIYRYPTKTALDAAALPTGTFALTVDQNVVWLRAATGWVATAFGNRVNFRLTAPAGGQNIGQNTVSNAVWSVAGDPFGVTNGSVFTVPAGWGGRYTFEWCVYFPVGNNNGYRQVFVQAAGVPITQHNSAPAGVAAGLSLSGAGSIMMTPGQTAGVAMSHTDTADILNCNNSASVYFHGYYSGPY